VLRHETGTAGGRYVRFEAAVAFGREYDAVLHVFELIEEVEGRAHRHLYAYHCLYRDRFLFRYDRDPDNHPEMPEHKHLPPDERRVAWDAVTLHEVLEEVHTLVAEIEAAEV
jgi:hypothetical protein